MRLIQLKYFLAVCKYENFTLAAKEFYVTQPAISAAIRELESEYQIRLFDRQKRELRLTEEGRWLKGRAEFVLNYLAATEEQLRVFSQNKRYLRLGVAPMIGALSLFAYFNDFCREYPDIHVDLLEAGSLQIRNWVADGIVDVGAQLVDGMPEDQFAITKLFDIALDFCVHKSHPLAQKKRITIPELAKEKLILLKEDSYQNQLIKEKFAACGQELDVLMYSNQISSIRNMLTYGNCGAFLFRKLIKPGSDLCAIPLDPPITLSVGLTRRKNQITYPPMQEFIRYTISRSKRS